MKVTYQNVDILRGIALCMGFDYTFDDRTRVGLCVDGWHGGLVDVVKYERLST